MLNEFLDMFPIIFPKFSLIRNASVGLVTWPTTGCEILRNLAPLHVLWTEWIHDITQSEWHTKRYFIELRFPWCHMEIYIRYHQAIKYVVFHLSDTVLYLAAIVCDTILQNSLHYDFADSGVFFKLDEYKDCE